MPVNCDGRVSGSLARSPSTSGEMRRRNSHFVTEKSSRVSSVGSYGTRDVDACCRSPTARRSRYGRATSRSRITTRRVCIATAISTASRAGRVGKASAHRARTGKVMWNVDGFGAGTLLSAGDLLVITRESGELVIAPASPNSFAPRSQRPIDTGSSEPIQRSRRDVVTFATNTLAAFSLRADSVFHEPRWNLWNLLLRHIHDDVVVGIQRTVGRQTANRVGSRILKRHVPLILPIRRYRQAPSTVAPRESLRPARVSSHTLACAGEKLTRPAPRYTKHEWRSPV